jgi:hypothetical protein
MRTIYPYETLAGDVTLALGDAETDGHAARGAWRDTDERVLDLSNLERAAWSTASIPVEVVGPPTELQERRAAGGNPTAHIVVQCGFTNTRQAYELTEDTDAARWRGEIHLDREFWFGRVEVSTYITDRVPTGEERVVGVADTWAVLLDDLPQSPVRGELTVVWRDFDDKDVDPPFLASAKGEPYYHFLDPHEPVLYLNVAFPGLEPLLRDRSGRRPAGEQALHDQVRVGIATKFLLAAANAALSSVGAEDGEPPSWPESDWQTELLESLLRRAYPKRAAEDALAEVVALLGTEDGAGQVQNLLISSVDQHVGANRLLKLSIKALGLEPEADIQGEDEQ